MSWISDYLVYTARQESPLEYHTWTAITTIAAALGRNVWLNRRSGGVTRYQVFPGQLMVVFVGGSGRVRKTTAVNPSKKFIRHIGKSIISGKSSPEAFLDQLDPAKGGTPNAVLIESEITVFLSKQNYSDPLIDVLIKLADAEDKFEFNTRGGGKIEIPKPCLTLFGATTPESLGERLPTGAHGSGFMSRIIFIYAKTTDRLDSLTDVEDTEVSAAELTDTKAAEARLFAEITALSKLAGPFTFTKVGKEWFDHFYTKWAQSTTGQGEGYPSRRPDHLLRISMIISAARGARETLKIDEISLRAADKLLHSAEANFDKAFAFIGTTYAKNRQRIVEFITSKAGRVTVGELYATMYPYFDDIAAVRRTLSLLKEAGVLTQSFSTTHPPQEFWSLAGISFKV